MTKPTLWEKQCGKCRHLCWFVAPSRAAAQEKIDEACAEGRKFGLMYCEQRLQGAVECSRKGLADCKEGRAARRATGYRTLR